MRWFAPKSLEWDYIFGKPEVSLPSESTTHQPPFSEPPELQKTSKLAPYVPYTVQLETARLSLLQNLKNSLCQAILEQGSALEQWIKALDSYLTLYSFAFTKQDHVWFVKLLLRTLEALEDDFPLLNKVIVMTSKLLDKTHLLNRSDLQINWHSLYSLYTRTQKSPHFLKGTLYLSSTAQTDLLTLIARSRPYFSAESISEILTQWRPTLCPYNATKFSNTIHALIIFLPTTVPTVHDHTLWFNDFMNLWMSLPNKETLNHYYIFIFARLAKDALGFINWEPHLPAIFNRFKERLNNSNTTTAEVDCIAELLVYMIVPKSTALEKMKQLFCSKLIKFSDIITQFTNNFIARIRLEAKVAIRWNYFTPESHKLTPELITSVSTDLIENCFPVITLAEFSIEVLHQFSLLCTDNYSKKILEKLTLAQERLFEPGRLTSALEAFAVFLYPMLLDSKKCSAYQDQIHPTLIALMKTINTNDQNLCFRHLFVIRSIVLLNVPLEESFPEQFIDLCFKIIECNNQDLFNLTKAGLAFDQMIFDILLHILASLNQANQQNLTDKILTYATGRIIESTHLLKFLEKMLQACFAVDKEDYCTAKLLTSISTNIISAIDGESKYADICKTEFIHNFRLLETLLTNGQSLLPHQNEIIDLLKVIYELDFGENFTYQYIITNTIWALFAYLADTYLPYQAYRQQQPNDLPDLQTPFRVSLSDLQVKWHVPSTAELAFVKRLLVEFIYPEMEVLLKYSNLEMDLSKAEVAKSLAILYGVYGLRYCFPKFEPIDDEINNHRFLTYHNTPDMSSLPDLFNGRDLRTELIQLMAKLAKKLKNNVSDNISAFKTILEMCNFLLFPYDVNYTKGEFTRNKIYKSLLKADGLNIPQVYFDRLSCYNQKVKTHTKQWQSLIFSTAHQAAIDLYFDLATCSSSTIRKDAQSSLETRWSSSLRQP